MVARIDAIEDGSAILFENSGVPGSKVRRSFARGTLADWAGWLPAREFASRSGAMNLEQVGPLDVHLLCRFGARLPPRSHLLVPSPLPCSRSSRCIFRFLRVRSPLPRPRPLSSPRRPSAASSCASRATSSPPLARATLLYFSFRPLYLPVLSARPFVSI